MDKSRTVGRLCNRVVVQEIYKITTSDTVQQYSKKNNTQTIYFDLWSLFKDLPKNSSFQAYTQGSAS